MTTESDKFRKGGSIPVKVLLKNTGPDPLLINNRLALNAPTAPALYREIAFTVTDPNGKPVYFGARVNIGRPDSRHFKELGPGETIERVYDLKGYYKFETPGQYTLQASYQNQSDGVNGHEPWKGEVKSNVGSLTIVAE
jgi:hypothetical protein